MSIFGRLRLDDVAASMPELGPGASRNRGFSWPVLIGVMIIQMSVPSVLSMYGAVLGGVTIRGYSNEITLLHEKIIIAPILLVAFCNLAHPWSSKVIKLASSPRLISIIGIILLAIGVLASGYLASGGVGAYFTNLSAGVVMGVSTDLVLQQTDQILRDNFRSKFNFAATLKDVASALGYIYMPLFTLGILEENPSEIALLMMAIVFVPAGIAALFLKNSTRQSNVSLPYTRLVSQDNELTSRDSYEILPTNQPSSVVADEIGQPAPISEASGVVFTYDDAEPNEETRSFSRTNEVRNNGVKVHQCVMMTVTWIGIKAGELFFWLFLPPLAIIGATNPISLGHAVVLSVLAGIGFFVIVLFAHWNLKNARSQCFIFGFSILMSSFVLFNLSRQNLDYFWLVALAILGGMSLAGLKMGEESARRFLMPEKTLRASVVVYTAVGISILLFFPIQNASMYLQIVSGIECVIGIFFAFAVTLTCFKYYQ